MLRQHARLAVGEVDGRQMDYCGLQGLRTVEPKKHEQVGWSHAPLRKEVWVLLVPFLSRRLIGGMFGHGDEKPKICCIDYGTLSLKPIIGRAGFSVCNTHKNTNAIVKVSLTQRLG